MNKYDIITFGSASEDIFITSKEFFRKNLRFRIGDKIEIDKIYIKSGGGGTNAAASFSLQGLKTAFCGSIGKDYGGFLILMDLEKLGIDHQFIYTLTDKTTNHSIILSEQDKGRTILVYRDASNYPPKDLDLKRLKASWFYLAPLGGEAAKETKKIINFAKRNKIKIAFNPSKFQISILKNETARILPKIDVFLVNEKEAKMLFGSFKNERELFRKIQKYVKGYLIITKGAKGSIIFDGKTIYRAGIVKTKVIDRTGAGDAFGSGFVSQLIKTHDLISAIQFATANSAACLNKWGAKEGILQQSLDYPKVKIRQYNL